MKEVVKWGVRETAYIFNISQNYDNIFPVATPGMAEELTWDTAWGTKNVTEIEVFLQIAWILCREDQQL